VLANTEIKCGLEIIPPLERINTIKLYIWNTTRKDSHQKCCDSNIMNIKPSIEVLVFGLLQRHPWCLLPQEGFTTIGKDFCLPTMYILSIIMFIHFNTCD
jgi:hypothetical protein